MTDLRQDIKDKGWRQGSILNTADALELLSQYGYSATGDDIAVVVTHSCDLLSEKLEAQPKVEVLLGRLIKVAELSPNYRNVKHPRILHCELEETAVGSVGVSFEMHRRFEIDRHHFQHCFPDQDRQFSLATLRQIATWLADRYVRDALPDDFNGRIKAKNVAKQFKNLSPHVIETRVKIYPDRDLNGDERYDCDLLLIVPQEADCEDEQLKAVSEKLKSNLKQKGVDCMIRIRNEQQVTYQQLRATKRLQLEFLSFANTDHPQ